MAYNFSTMGRSSPLRCALVLVPYHSVFYVHHPLFLGGGGHTLLFGKGSVPQPPPPQPLLVSTL